MSVDGDVVRQNSTRICTHMNADHVDSMMHMVMHFEHKRALPTWCCMESICATHAIIRYLERDRPQEGLESFEAVPMVRIPFDPPLQSMMDARKRLVALSKLSEEENERVFKNASVDVLDLINVDVIIQSFVNYIADPITLITLCVMYGMAQHPEKVTQSTWLQHRLVDLQWPLQVLSCIFMVVVAMCSLQWLSTRWTNAAPVPPTVVGVPGWALSTLLRRPLPKLAADDWKSETVVVSGGATGLGAILCRKLADRGANVISLDIARSHAVHPRISAYNCDITRRADVESVAQYIVHRHGAPTMLVNNAAVMHGQPLVEMTPEALAQTMNTNVTSAFWLVREFLPAMIKRRRGHVVTVASALGYTGIAQLSDYVASKHALIGLHDSLRSELDTLHRTPFVRTTLVVPGQLRDTRMFSGLKHNALARFVAPSVSAGRVADAVADALAAQESRFIAMPWYARWMPLLNVVPSFVRDAVQTALGANVAMSTRQPRT